MRVEHLHWRNQRMRMMINGNNWSYHDIFFGKGCRDCRLGITGKSVARSRQSYPSVNEGACLQYQFMARSMGSHCNPKAFCNGRPTFINMDFTKSVLDSSCQIRSRPRNLGLSRNVHFTMPRNLRMFFLHWKVGFSEAAKME